MFALVVAQDRPKRPLRHVLSPAHRKGQTNPAPFFSSPTIAMLTWFRTLTCHRISLTRQYSVAIAPELRKKWGVCGLPRPRSILDDDYTAVDLSEDNEIVNGSRPGTPPPHLRRPPEKPTPNEYKAHREIMRKEFPNGWNPPRKVTREAMEGIRQMHHLDPATFTTPVLAEKFKISPEAVRRILKSRWEPPRDKRLKIAEREREDRAAYLRSKQEQERTEAQEVAEARKIRRDGLAFQ